MPARVVSLHHYPVKGLGAQEASSLAVSVAEGLAGDRRYALALGSTAFDPARPEPLDKGYFLMLRRNEALAALSTHYDAAGATLTVEAPDGRRVEASVATDAGRTAIEDYFLAYIGDACEGRPRLVEAPGHKFTDVSVVSPVMMKAISFINRASIRDFEARLGRSLHPLRFRANIYAEGLEPFAEIDWVGREVAIGSARFRCVMETKRCAAVDVDPVTGARDAALPKALMKTYGHPNLGVYLEVIGDGTFACGDAIALDA